MRSSEYWASSRIHAAQQLAAWIPASANTVLDAYAIDGKLADALANRPSVHLYGIGPGEPPDGYHSFALDVSGCGAIPGSWPAFDCVVSIEGFACARDPEPLAAQIAACMAPNALLLATVPNMQHYRTIASIAAGQWHYGEGEGPAERHLRFYTQASIAQLLRKHGLTVHRTAAFATDDEPEEDSGDAAYIRFGDYRFGPLGATERKAFLAREVLVLAQNL